MIDQDIDLYQFEYKHGKALFDILFFIVENSYVLLFGAKGENFSFEIKVSDSFEIEPYIESETYSGLCRVLRLRYNPDNRFSTRGFFVGLTFHTSFRAANINTNPMYIKWKQNITCNTLRGISDTD